MSQVLIDQYLGELDRLKKVGGMYRGSAAREAFKDLLKDCGDLRVWGGSIHEKFDTDRFADDEEKVIDLPALVAMVGVQTMTIAEVMRSVSG
jgi:hypothetical protein